MKQHTILHIVGARPNFMKAAAVILASRKMSDAIHSVVHTGQHYDSALSDVFFQELGLPQPQHHLGVGSGTHAEQTGTIMMKFEQILQQARPPSCVIVYGDVNSTMACALVCAKLGIMIAHIEAGLRSFDRTMPEEINRVLTDHVSDILFTTEESASKNLLSEGIPDTRVFFAGNTMIDTLMHFRAKAMQSSILQRLNLAPKTYGVVTLHRPGNVDSVGSFREVLSSIVEISAKIPIVFPCHPRSQANLHRFNIPLGSIMLLPPLGYLDFLCLMAQAKVVLTDSGGIQEETTALGIPCLTIRENTERPVTVTSGTNILTGISQSKIMEEIQKILAGHIPSGQIPPFWDGHAGERIIQILSHELSIS